MNDPFSGAREKERAHGQFLDTGREPSDAEIREAILASWQRSKTLGVGQESLYVPAESTDPEGRLRRAAKPALSALAARMSRIPVAILLTDAEARILDRAGDPAMLAAMDDAQLVEGASCAERYIGTNSISMVLGTQSPFVVVGQEHYFHSFQVLACLGAPVRDPIGGAVEGTINLSIPREAADPGMALTLESTARHIEHRLLELSTNRERALAEQFLTGAARGPMLPDESDVPTPGDALIRELPTEDQARLVEKATEMIAAENLTFAEVPLSRGRSAVLRRRKLQHGDAVGAAVEMSLHGQGPAPPPSPEARPAPAEPADSGEGNLPGPPGLPGAVDLSALAPGGGPAPTGPEAGAGIRPGGEPGGTASAGARTGPGNEDEAGPGPAPAQPQAGAAGSAPQDGPGRGAGDGESASRWPLLIGEPSVGRLAVAARRRLSLLNDASARIGATLDVRRTTQEFAGVVVPRLADLLVVDLLAGLPEGEEPGPAPLSPESALVRTAVATGPVAAGGSAPATGARFSYPATAPQARGLTHATSLREPVVGTSAAGPGPADEPAAYLGEGRHSLIVVPLRARGSVLGLASFYRAESSGPFEEDDLVMAEELTGRTAVCVDNARRYTRERSASLTLQHSLLPRDIPELSAVDVSARYLPARAKADVGGDWYDVIALSGTRVALVVGDVVGHGLHAAATMGRLRGAVRTLADLDLPPEEVLAHLDRMVSQAHPGDDRDDPAIGAALVYAVYDPISGHCTAARAGHPQPVVITPDGGVGPLDLPAGLPLGSGGHLPYAAGDHGIPEGGVLALYSNGLLGQCGRTKEGHSRELLEIFRHHEPSLEGMCEVITSRLGAPGERASPRDDITLLLARTKTLPPARVAEWSLDAEAANVRSARALVERQLADWELSELAGSVELVVSELVTNAVRYGGGGGRIGLRLIRDHSLICEVSDRSNSSPRIRRAGTGEEGGRGLFLVAQYSSAWGARYTPEGKTVWAERPLTETVPPTADEETLLAAFGEL